MTRSEMITEAVELLDAGVLTTVLPGEVIRRHKRLTPREAMEVALAAIKQRQKAGKK